MKPGEFLSIKQKSLNPIKGLYKDDSFPVKLTLPNETWSDKKFQDRLLSKKILNSQCQTSTQHNNIQPVKIMDCNSDYQTIQPKVNSQRHTSLDTSLKSEFRLQDAQNLNNINPPDSLAQSLTDRGHLKNQISDNKIINHLKIQPLHFTNIDAGKIIPKQPKQIIYNDCRNKSITYLQNIFKKSLLKQQSQHQLNNDEALPQLQQIFKSNENASNTLYSQKMKNTFTNNFNNQLNQKDQIQQQVLNIQKQQSDHEEGDNFSVIKQLTSCKTTRENTLSQLNEKDKSNKLITLQNTKDLIKEYFTTNHSLNKHMEEILKIGRDSLDEEKSYEISQNIQDENDLNLSQTEVSKRQIRQLAPLERYDSTKFENKLRQKNNLQVLGYEEDKEKGSNFLQSSINNQSQMYRNLSKFQKTSSGTFSPSHQFQQDFHFEKVLRDSLPNKVINLFSDSPLNLSIQNRNQRIEIQKLTRWDEEFLTEKKMNNLEQEQQNKQKRERQNQLMQQGLWVFNQESQPKQRRQPHLNHQQRHSIEQEFSLKINKHLKGNGSFDNYKLQSSIDKNALKENTENTNRKSKQLSIIPQSSSDQFNDTLKFNSKLNSVSSRSLLQNKIKFFNQSNSNSNTNNLNNNLFTLKQVTLSNDISEKFIQPSKKQQSVSDICQLKKPKKRNDNIQETQNIQLSGIFMAESYDIENYINEQRHIK